MTNRRSKSRLPPKFSRIPKFLAVGCDAGASNAHITHVVVPAPSLPGTLPDIAEGPRHRRPDHHDPAVWAFRGDDRGPGRVGTAFARTWVTIPPGRTFQIFVSIGRFNFRRGCHMET